MSLWLTTSSKTGVRFTQEWTRAAFYGSAGPTVLACGTLATTNWFLR